jgi:hypothetical protein
MNKFLIAASLALAAFTATPTFAATVHRTSHISTQQAYPESYDANARAADADLTTNGPGVFSNGQYAGWDPDPNIRFQLLRDAGAQMGN